MTLYIYAYKYKCNIYVCLQICNISLPKSLIEYTLDQNYFFNLNQINIVLRQKIENTPHKNVKSTRATTKSQKHATED